MNNIDWSRLFTSETWIQIFTSDAFASFIRISLLLFIGIPLTYMLSKTVQRRVAKRYSAHHGMLISKVTFYGALVFIGVSVLQDLDVELTPILGAAGIVGIAVGFASQTSVSNIISGLFLIAEKPFVVGDVITIGDTTGEVLSIDILSIKIRTFENQFVRIPNETIIKNKLTNISRFPIRRVDILISVAHKEKVDVIRNILFDVARNTPQCLQEPEPLIVLNSIHEALLNFTFSVWAAKEDWLAVKNVIQENIKARFEAEGINR